MTAKKTYYVTTPIYYPNDIPHIGHAYTTIAADILARWNKLQGKEVFFLTGTDEHGKKIQLAAEKAGKSPKEFVDALIPKFKEAWHQLNINYDKFIRTTDKEHETVVQQILQKVYKKGDIYKGSYEGFYCTGCEAYYTEKDLVDGCCPIHKTKIEKLQEESYFFKLGKYQKKLLELYKKNPDFISPAHRKQEVINRVREGLQDLSISRTSFNWGIPLPFDKKHICYVWFDALTNYYSATREKGREKFWPANTHLVGKDILWFHTVIWPAMLLSAGIKTPKQVFAHGWWTFDKEKISKSRGKIINIPELISIAGVDSARYFLFKQTPFGEDGDFSEQALIARHNNELADKLGNLVSRVSALAEMYSLKKSKVINTKPLVKKVQAHFEKYEFDRALNEIFTFIDSLNELVQKNKPWETHDSKFLYQISNAIKDVSVLLSPFIPETTEKISRVFNFQLSLKSLGSPLKISKVKKAQILFNKINPELNKEGNQVTNMASKVQKAVKKTEKALVKAEKVVERVVEKAVSTASKDVRKTLAKTEQKAKEFVQDLGDKVEKKAEQVGIKEQKIEGVLQFEHWEKLDLRVARVKKVEEIEGADKLYKLTLDVGDLGERIVCAGIKQHYTPEELKGKKLIYFSNLAPRNMRGVMSQGMILAAVTKDHSRVILIAPEKDIDVGARVS